MDEDGGDVRGKRGEAGAYGFLAGFAAGDDQDLGPLGQGVLVDEPAHLGGAVGRGDDDHEGDGPGAGHRADGVDEHGGAAEGPQGLGGAGAEAYPAAGGRDHRGGAVGARFVRHQ